MVEAAEVNKELYEDILAKITALCKGFLLVADKSTEKACTFCKGFLIMVEQLSTVMPEVPRANNNNQ